MDAPTLCNNPEPNFPDERAQLLAGGADALADLLQQYQAPLERIVHFRLTPVLRSRIEPADVLQEAYFDISRRIQEYIDGVPVSFFVWIRQKTLQTLIDIQRKHLSEKRDANREVFTALPSHGQTSSLSIAKLLLDDITSPSQAAVRAEEIQELRSALESMNETDREVIAMRHFEHLNNQQVAEVLGLSPTAASNRYIRAAVKLGEILKSLSSRHGPP
jgi:RNA polymerase sigma-70 factor (ECF subfamily)